jgi:uncharacterized membrane protein YeaQ/YmgE (transglycosylase-associated protein family)
MEIGAIVLIGLVVGLVADTVIPGRMPFGYLVAIVLGIAGAAVGGYAFAEQDFLGFTVGNVAIGPAVLGALVPVLLLELLIFIFGRRPRR